MPVGILSDAQRAEWERFPPEIDDAALAACFTLDPQELERLASHRDIHGRVAAAAAMGSLRWLGIVPLLLSELPAPAAALIAGQLDVDLDALDPARMDYQRVVHARLVARAAVTTGFRTCNPKELERLAVFLAERALVHDGPMVLLREAVDRLRRDGLLRPGITVLERVVANARVEAEHEIARRLKPVLSPALQGALDGLMLVSTGRSAAPVKEMGQETRSVARVGEPIAKLELLRGLGADGWDLEAVPARRRRMLAHYVRHASSQALSRRGPEFRYPALLAFCAQASGRVTDELVDLLDDGISNQHASARRALNDAKLATADETNSSVILLGELLEVLLNPQVADEQVRREVWQRATPQELQRALELAARIKRPVDNSHLQQLGRRYRATRKFAPQILDALELQATADGASLLAAVEYLRDLNRRDARRLPSDAPTGFVPRSWRPYVFGEDGALERHHWELCLLSELRLALRSGEIWVQGSRRYLDPERFLISRTTWAAGRPALLEQLELSTQAGERLGQHNQRTTAHREVLDAQLAAGESEVTITAEGGLSVKRLAAEPRQPDVDELAREIANRLPVVDLPDLLIDIDRRTGFLARLTHAGGAKPRRADHARHLFASVIAQACNLGTGRMARASDLSAASIGWTSEWYLRHETLEAATALIVDHQSTIPLAQRFGSGEHSSSDGKRRIVSPDSQQAKALPRYFGRDRGLTHYGFISDQHTHFATRVIRTTVRDATHVLDGILENPSGLPIKVHSTDTAGYSDIIFALFDLLGLQFAPRLAGFSDARLWRPAGPAHASPAGRLLGHTVDTGLIAEQWDEMLRLAASLHQGTVTASLLVTRLHARQRRSRLSAALQDYGRLVKTEYILRQLTRPDERRAVHHQLNKQESVHALHDAVFYGNEARIRAQSLDRQSTQAAALALVTTAIVTWNTHHMNEIVDQLVAAGRDLDELDLGRLSPVLHAHINLNGRYHIDPDQPTRHRTQRVDAPAIYR